jgi:hypothetical protein
MTTKEIKELVEQETNNTLDTKTRKRDIVYTRAVYFKLCRVHTLLPLSEIGLIVNKNHATVLHGLRLFNNVLVEYEQSYLELFSKLDEQIRKQTGKKLRNTQKLLNPEIFYRKKYTRLLLEHRDISQKYRNLKKFLNV